MSRPVSLRALMPGPRPLTAPLLLSLEKLLAVERVAVEKGKT